MGNFTSPSSRLRIVHIRLGFLTVFSFFAKDNKKASSLELVVNYNDKSPLELTGHNLIFFAIGEHILNFRLFVALMHGEVVWCTRNLYNKATYLHGPTKAFYMDLRQLAL